MAQSTLFPFDPAFDLPPKLQWKVVAVDKKGHPIDDGVFIRATTREGALAAGKRWRRICGFPRAKNVVALRYHPERDHYMTGCGWVRPTSEMAA